MEVMFSDPGTYKTGPGPRPGPGLEQPITEQCTTRKMTKVPIQFEPMSDSPLPVSSNCPKSEKIVALGCAERYICLKRCTCTFGPPSKEAAYLPAMCNLPGRNGPD